MIDNLPNELPDPPLPKDYYTNFANEYRQYEDYRSKYAAEFKNYERTEDPYARRNALRNMHSYVKGALETHNQIVTSELGRPDAQNRNELISAFMVLGNLIDQHPQLNDQLQSPSMISDSASQSTKIAHFTDIREFSAEESQRVDASPSPQDRSRPGFFRSIGRKVSRTFRPKRSKSSDPYHRNAGSPSRSRWDALRSDRAEGIHDKLQRQRIAIHERQLAVGISDKRRRAAPRRSAPGRETHRNRSAADTQPGCEATCA